MNKEKLLELSDTLRGIAEGKEWEVQCSDPTSEWKKPLHKCPYQAMRFGWYIRLKPQPPPDPYAELKAAHAAGKTIQRNEGGNMWIDSIVKDRKQDPFAFVCPPESYRIKPEPRKVPLGPDDVPPGCAVRSNLWCDPEWRFIAHVYLDGVLLSNCESTQSWDKLETYYLINRSIPLTGKWDKDAWEPCYKLIEE